MHPAVVFDAPSSLQPGVHTDVFSGELSHQIEKDGASAVPMATATLSGSTVSGSTMSRRGTDSTLLLEGTLPVGYGQVAVNAPPDRGSWATRLATFLKRNGLAMIRQKLPSNSSPKDLRMVILHDGCVVGWACGVGVYGNAQVNANVELVCQWALSVAWWALQEGLAPPPAPFVAPRKAATATYTALHYRGLYHYIDLTGIDGAPTLRQSIVGTAVARALEGRPHECLEAVFVDGEGQGWCTCPPTCPQPCANKFNARCKATHVQVALVFSTQPTIVICDYVETAGDWTPVVSGATTAQRGAATARVDGGATAHVDGGETLFAVWGGMGVDEELAKSFFEAPIVDLQRLTAFCEHLRGMVTEAARSLAEASQPLGLKWAAHALCPPASQPELAYDSHKDLHCAVHFGCWQREPREKLTEEHRAYAAVDAFAGSLACSELRRWSRRERCRPAGPGRVLIDCD